ncbi:MAG: MipA/OmpV family protein, partial [bacterium]
MIYFGSSSRITDCYLLFVCLFHSSTILAASQITEIQLRDVPKGSVGLGFGRRFGQSPYVGIDSISSQENENSSDLVPLYYYEGRYLFAHGTTAGIHLLDNEKFNFDLLARFRFDRLEETDDPFFEGVEERRQSIDTGISFTWKNSWGDLSTTAVNDTLDRHGGAEADISYQYSWRINKWLISPGVSFIYQNSTLTNYYYGVSPDEARPGRPEYETTSAQFVRLGLHSTYRVNKRKKWTPL